MKTKMQDKEVTLFNVTRTEKRKKAAAVPIKVVVGAGTGRPMRLSQEQVDHFMKFNPVWVSSQIGVGV